MSSNSSSFSITFGPQKRGIEGASIAIYALFSAFAIFTLVTICLKGHYKRIKPWIMLSLCFLVQFVGNIILLYVSVQEHDGHIPSTGLVQAGLIMTSISIGPLMLAPFFILNTGGEVATGEPILPTKAVSLVTLATIAAIALNISAISSGSESYTAAGYKAGSILYMVVAIINTGYAIICYSSPRFAPSYKPYAVVVALAGPFLFVRTLNSILFAFTFDSSNFLAYDKYSSFNGDWKIYLVMIFLMQVIVSALYLVGGYLVEHKGNVEYPRDHNLNEIRNAGDSFDSHERYPEPPLVSVYNGRSKV